VSASPDVTVRHRREDVSLWQRQSVPQAGQYIARRQPWFPDVQGSASEAPVERRYDPKRADGSRKSAKARESARRLFALNKAAKAAKVAAFGDA
jgi:hypothetical protein